ncbi:hypothetical protein ACHAWC_001279 [Mediolabrus comicus]
MFKKLFSTATILLLAASSQSAAADGTKSAKGATNCAGNEGTQLFMKLTLARQAALQFVGLYSLGDGDDDIEGLELATLVNLVGLLGVDVESAVGSFPQGVFDGDKSSYTLDEITATLLVLWEDFCAEDIKGLLDGLILPRIPGYNVDYVLTTDE